MTERVTVDEKRRMYLNGETRRCMEHAHKLKALNQNTSVDQPWEIDESLACKDTYVKVCSALHLLPKFLFCYPLLVLLQLPGTLACWLYLKSLPTPCDSMRGSCGFSGLCILLCFLSAPLAFFVACLLYADYAMYYFYGFVYCLVTCGWSRYFESLKVIRPYRCGPCIVFRLGDVVHAFLGQMSRQGFCEANNMLAGMFILMPWMKYFINCNPWVYALEERFVQQISTSMQDASYDQSAEAVLAIISRCKQNPPVRDEVDSWSFSPCYAFPPSHRRFAIGMQSGSTSSCIAFFLLVHTTHALCKNGGSTEQFVLSNSSCYPCYRVMLWYSNPYHFLTGWVEASLSTGLPDQPDKNRGGEHPMWIVTSRSPFLSRRSSYTGVGFIDQFFDRFLPTYVKQARTILRGKQVAEELFEDVVSKDGVSRPKMAKQVPLVDSGAGLAHYYLSADKAKRT